LNVKNIVNIHLILLKDRSKVAKITPNCTPLIFEMYGKCLSHTITWWRWYHENSVNSRRNAICFQRGSRQASG